MRLSQLLTSHRSRDDDRSDLLAYAGTRIVSWTARAAFCRSVTACCSGSFPSCAGKCLASARRKSACRCSSLGTVATADWRRRYRASSFGAQLFRILTHDDKRLILAPTRRKLLRPGPLHRDARDLPRVFYQIQPRFRDQESAAESG